MKKIVLLLFMLLVVGCNNRGKVSTSSKEFFAMDTYMKLSATAEESEKLLEESYTTIEKIESKISRTDTESDIYRLNHSQGKVVTVDNITYEILDIALDCAKETNGLFDPTICAITDLWAVGTENARVPEKKEIEDALETVSYKNIILLENNQVQLLHGTQLDLGAVGKGYAADKVVEIYQKYEANSGVISLAGNIYLYGEKEDGSLWNVGIVDPESTDDIAMSLKTGQTSVVTTGAYERYFEKDGVVYHHIFDPQTGYSSTEDLNSVTVVFPDSAYADIYATALFIMGYDEAIDFANKNGLDVVLIRDSGEVYISEEIREDVTVIQ